jgi:hypothetical protein
VGGNELSNEKNELQRAVPNCNDEITFIGTNSFALAGLGLLFLRSTHGGADFVSLALGYLLSGFQPLDIGFRLMETLIG